MNLPRITLPGCPANEGGGAGREDAGEEGCIAWITGGVNVGKGDIRNHV